VKACKAKILRKMAFLKNCLNFLAKNAIFSENFWDLLRFSQICSKIFKKILTPQPPKNFPEPHPPPKIFDQARMVYIAVCHYAINQ
jgi:hypothetical protein